MATKTLTAALGIAAISLLPSAPSAWAHDGPHPPPSPAAPAKGSPLAGPDFFADHLARYHWNRTLIGFDRAAGDPYDWAVYHFLPTNLETATRALSPADAPEAEGDTWVPAPAGEAEPGHGHGPPSHAGQPLRAPIDPTAGVEYLVKWGGGNPGEAVPAVQEGLRRSITPTEDRPPNTVDKWEDQRPAGGAHSGRVLLPAEAAAVPAQASAVAGKFATGLIGTVGGGSGHSVLPVGGLVPRAGG